MVKPGWHPVWVVDFPMFLEDPATRALSAVHHPFTRPLKEDEEKLNQAMKDWKTSATY